MLGNIIALWALSAFFGVEAFKVKDRIPRLIFAVLAITFAMSGLTLPWTADKAPAINEWLSEISGNPLSWLILIIGLFFVARPFWSRSTRPVIADQDEAALRAKFSEAEQRLASLAGQQDALSRSRGASSDTEQLLGKIFLFEKRLPLFDKEIQAIESEWATFDRHAKMVDADVRTRRASPSNLFEAVKSAERRLFGMGIKIKLYDHSRFNADPHDFGGPLREVPDDLKPSYRKALDLQDHALTRLKAHKAKLIKEVDEAKGKIESLYTANKSPEDWGLYED